MFKPKFKNVKTMLQSKPKFKNVKTMLQSKFLSYCKIKFTL